ncbi:hypothetical protein LSH36_15g18025 [Paralvinella palmiformis]|uniref:Uncharacterized protein n=1 Tax=Paralvinella palmiformis TaxID=53620 RepID=A0AAD9KCN0_9ANNE|nr:hypothetical protein LSH36_15g18025 [Paralvinella palmiformis]
MKMRSRITFFFFLNALLSLRATVMTDFVDELLDPKRYDRRVRPGVDSGKPVIVSLDMFVNSISSLDEVKMEYVLSIFMRQRWIDDRLNFTTYTNDVTLNYNMFDQLWVPDLFIKNEKKATFHQITVPNRLLKLSPNGQVYYSQRLTLTLSCGMHLKYYPMDNQTCKIELESYGYTTKDLIFEWNTEKDPVQVSDWLEMPEFTLTNVSTGDCTLDYVTGSFTCKYATFKLKRQFEYYLIQTFIPSCLIVSLSWVSFWIDIHAVPARVTLGLLTVLTMTTQSSGISSRLPRVSYIKAIDIWMTCCLVFVFGALIEYSIVNVLARKGELAAKKKDEKKVKDEKMNTEVENDLEEGNTVVIGAVSVQISDENTPASCNIGQTDRVRESASNSYSVSDIYNPKKRQCCRDYLLKMKNSPALGVDIVSRFLFPSIFLIFNIIYWITYKFNVQIAPNK